MGVIPNHLHPLGWSSKVRQISQCRLSQQPANHCQTINRYQQTPETPNLESHCQYSLAGSLSPQWNWRQKQQKKCFQSKFPYLKIKRKKCSRPKTHQNSTANCFRWGWNFSKGSRFEFRHVIPSWRVRVCLWSTSFLFHLATKTSGPGVGQEAPKKHPIGNIYKWCIYCQLGDYMYHLPPMKGTRNNHWYKESYNPRLPIYFGLFKGIMTRFITIVGAHLVWKSFYTIHTLEN